MELSVLQFPVLSSLLQSFISHSSFLFKLYSFVFELLCSLENVLDALKCFKGESKGEDAKKEEKEKGQDDKEKKPADGKAQEKDEQKPDSKSEAKDSKKEGEKPDSKPSVDEKV